MNVYQGRLFSNKTCGSFIIYIMKMCYTNVSNFGRMISFSIVIVISQNEYFSFYIERSND